jgi:NAD(P)-dependent dehydrogenase (short-subunit alcohol dehydrogenase family)
VALAPRPFRGQGALVTGATSGIGRAVALQLAREGAEVIVHGRSEPRGSETLSETGGDPANQPLV